MIVQPAAVDVAEVLDEAARALDDGLVLVLPVILLDEFPGYAPQGRCHQLAYDLRRRMGLDNGPCPRVHRLGPLTMLLVWHSDRYVARFTSFAEDPGDIVSEIQLHGPASRAARRVCANSFPLPGTHLTVLRCPEGAL